jgi:hypothetical protein
LSKGWQWVSLLLKIFSQIAEGAGASVHSPKKKKTKQNKTLPEKLKKEKEKKSEQMGCWTMKHGIYVFWFLFWTFGVHLVSDWRVRVWGYQSLWWHYWWWVSQATGCLLYVRYFFVISITSWGYQGVGSIICCWDSRVANCCFTVTILFVHYVFLWELWGIQVEQIPSLLHLLMCLFLIMHRLSVLLVYC